MPEDKIKLTKDKFLSTCQNKLGSSMNNYSARLNSVFENAAKSSNNNAVVDSCAELRSLYDNMEKLQLSNKVEIYESLGMVFHNEFKIVEVISLTDEEFSRYYESKNNKVEYTFMITENGEIVTYHIQAEEFYPNELSPRQKPLFTFSAIDDNGNRLKEPYYSHAKACIGRNNGALYIDTNKLYRMEENPVKEVDEPSATVHSKDSILINMKTKFNSQEMEELRTFVLLEMSALIDNFETMYDNYKKHRGFFTILGESVYDCFGGYSIDDLKVAKKALLKKYTDLNKRIEKGMNFDIAWQETFGTKFNYAVVNELKVTSERYSELSQKESSLTLIEQANSNLDNISDSHYSGSAIPTSMPILGYNDYKRRYTDEELEKYKEVLGSLSNESEKTYYETTLYYLAVILGSLDAAKKEMQGLDINSDKHDCKEVLDRVKSRLENEIKEIKHKDNQEYPNYDLETRMHALSNTIFGKEIGAINVKLTRATSMSQTIGNYIKMVPVIVATLVTRNPALLVTLTGTTAMGVEFIDQWTQPGTELKDIDWNRVIQSGLYTSAATGMMIGAGGMILQGLQRIPVESQLVQKSLEMAGMVATGEAVEFAMTGELTIEGAVFNVLFVCVHGCVKLISMRKASAVNDAFVNEEISTAQKQKIEELVNNESTCDIEFSKDRSTNSYLSDDKSITVNVTTKNGSTKIVKTIKITPEGHSKVIDSKTSKIIQHSYTEAQKNQLKELAKQTDEIIYITDKKTKSNFCKDGSIVVEISSKSSNGVTTTKTIKIYPNGKQKVIATKEALPVRNNSESSTESSNSQHRKTLDLPEKGELKPNEIIEAYNKKLEQLNKKYNDKNSPEYQEKLTELNDAKYDLLLEASPYLPEIAELRDYFDIPDGVELTKANITKYSQTKQTAFYRQFNGDYNNPLFRTKKQEIKANERKLMDLIENSNSNLNIPVKRVLTAKEIREVQKIKSELDNSNQNNTVFDIYSDNNVSFNNRIEKLSKILDTEDKINDAFTNPNIELTQNEYAKLMELCYRRDGIHIEAMSGWAHNGSACVGHYNCKPSARTNGIQKHINNLGIDGLKFDSSSIDSFSQSTKDLLKYAESQPVQNTVKTKSIVGKEPNTRIVDVDLQISGPLGEKGQSCIVTKVITNSQGKAYKYTWVGSNEGNPIVMNGNVPANNTGGVLVISTGDGIETIMICNYEDFLKRVPFG